MDVMYVNNCMEVILSAKHIKHPIHRTILVMETAIDHPGFARLKYKALGLSVSQSRPGTHTGERLYFSANLFLDDYTTMTYSSPILLHGPCVSDQHQTVDVAFCLRCKYLPQNAIPWVFRRRWQWPPNFVIDSIINYGCLLVPIGPKTIQDNQLVWRLSFSVAEKILVHSFNFTQLLCYGLLKLMLKCIVNTHDVVKDLLFLLFEDGFILDFGGSRY
ncbi:Hypothetical predicted protein [Mytilus galloprovincialis]|uniref:Mab-21-like nucleotidyltransferase domain-containing protein n=1 Tax=Mytilus galloprovincialis TaxID=29158 RepID=A0A8B6GIA7_MYTGA|nr:Hypothetical predicted protein [Mytilus galloprovincialis]